MQAHSILYQRRSPGCFQQSTKRSNARSSVPVPAFKRPQGAYGKSSKDASRLAKEGECGPQRAVKAVAAVSLVLTAGAFLAALLLPADARVLTERLGQEEAPPQRSRGSDIQDWFQSKSSRQRSDLGNSQKAPDVKGQVSEVLRISADAKQATKDGKFEQALEDYTQIVRQFPDLAITNYAKIGRAMLLYQTGSKNQAILELEDLEVALRGNPEVHAALATLIYSERPQEISYAEEQFDLASEFDQRYGNVEWVASKKLWPPAMLSALDKFLNLR